MKSFLCASSIFYTLYKNSTFNHEIQNSRCSKSNKNNENSKKKMIIFSYKSFLFYKLSLISYTLSLFFINIRISKNEIRNSRYLKPNKKNKNRNLKRLYSFKHIRHDISYKKIRFLTKNRFLTNLFTNHLMHIKNRSTHNR